MAVIFLLLMLNCDKTYQGLIIVWIRWHGMGRTKALSSPLFHPQPVLAVMEAHADFGLKIISLFHTSLRFFLASLPLFFWHLRQFKDYEFNNFSWVSAISSLSLLIFFSKPLLLDSCSSTALSIRRTKRKAVGLRWWRRRTTDHYNALKFLT